MLAEKLADAAPEESFAPSDDCRLQLVPSGNLHTFDLPGGLTNTAEKSITIRLADLDGERNRANMLLSRKYSARGYGKKHAVPQTSNSVTFTASTQQGLIGTLSLVVDSESGLGCDKTFRPELDSFRQVPGAKLCELTRFAFDTSKPSMHLLASLFHIIFIYGTHHYNCTDLFIEVNPRHRRFYQSMLGFECVGGVKTNDAVGAPSQLMRLKVAEIRRYIDEHTSQKVRSSHSLYPYFFSHKEEVGIYGRLAAGMA